MVVQREAKSPRIIVNIFPNSNMLVILFGWAGCRDRYLKKYSDYYEKAGISTIRYTTPIGKVLGYPSYRYFAVKFFHEVLEQDDSISHFNVYFHCFSMNGCSTFTALWDLLDKKPNGSQFKKRVQGILFDSSPAFTSAGQVAHAISFASMPPSRCHSALRESYRAVLYVFLSIFHSILWMWSLIEKDVYEKWYAYHRMLALEDLPTRQIYLYGTGDHVCSVESIEAFAEAQQRRGATVQLRLWKDSLHCQHYRSHTTEYEQYCLDFVLESRRFDDVTRPSDGG
uniref:Transmembrane protein 53 n=1 Tax=Angiostrongylus cantonensis TaxID=6313 RepID=A0A158P8R1_ANGCA